MKITAGVVVIVCLWGSWAGADYKTREIFAGQFKQIIPVQGSGQAWMDPVTLSVNVHGIMSDIDVYLDITHSEVSDLWIFLDAPQGDTVVLKNYELMDQLWKNTPKLNMYATIFDDEADLELRKGIPPYSGRFKPAQDYSLSQFNGLDIYGDWTLRIYDMALADTGVLDRWELHIEYINTPEPMIICYLGLPLLLGCWRNRGPWRRSFLNAK